MFLQIALETVCMATLEVCHAAVSSTGWQPMLPRPVPCCQHMQEWLKTRSFHLASLLNVSHCNDSSTAVSGSFPAHTRPAILQCIFTPDSDTAALVGLLVLCRHVWMRLLLARADAATCASNGVRCLPALASTHQQQADQQHAAGALARCCCFWTAVGWQCGLRGGRHQALSTPLHGSAHFITSAAVAAVHGIYFST